MLSIKEGVSIRGMQPQIGLAITIVATCLDSLNIDCVITSLTEGRHSGSSLHYVGFAVDIRTLAFPDNAREPVKNKLKILLGAEFDVVLESDHLHIEYQPKGPE